MNNSFDNKSTRIVDEQLLRDFAKGQLDEVEEDRIVALLERNPELQAKVAAISVAPIVRKMQVHSQVIKQKSLSSQVGPIDDAPELPNTSPALIDIPQELEALTEYEIVKELGRGGMGVVYLARHKMTDRLEVLKVLTEKLVENADARDRFLQEVKVTSALDHPSIVKSYTVRTLGELVVFVMEYVDGRDLHSVISKSGQLPIHKACNIAVDVCEGLQHAMKKDAVHRDIKPSNIMLFRNDDRRVQAKILDFGLGRLANQEVRQTETGSLMGTIEYISPEQSMNAADVDIRADIYSLGCTLYHMLVGHPPFSGSYGELIMAHSTKVPPAVNLVQPTVPRALGDIVAKMLAKKEDRRYQTPREVAEALKPFISTKEKRRIPKPPPETHGPRQAAARDTSVVERPTITPTEPISSPLQPAPIAGIPNIDITVAAETKTFVRKKKPQKSWRVAAVFWGAAALILLTIILKVTNPDGTTQELESDGDSLTVRTPDGYTITASSNTDDLNGESPEDLLSLHSQWSGTLTQSINDAGSTAQNVTAEVNQRTANGFTITIDQMDVASGDKLQWTFECTAEGASFRISSAVQRHITVDATDNSTGKRFIDSSTVNLSDKALAINLSRHSGSTPILETYVLNRDSRSMLGGRDDIKRSGVQSISTITNSIGMKLSLLPAGKFLMGAEEDTAKHFGLSDEDLANERPRHTVSISRPFYMATTVVTQSQWNAVMDYEPWEGKYGITISPDYPVAWASWAQAKEFCKRLSKIDGREYDLPTEAQWEYACRAGSDEYYSFGASDTHLGDYAWYSGNATSVGHKNPMQVGQKLPNAFGLYDMHGNLYEWCLDSYTDDAYKKTARVDPVNTVASKTKVIRGGGWRDGVVSCRSAKRNAYQTRYHTYSCGFRVTARHDSVANAEAMASVTVGNRTRFGDHSYQFFNEALTWTEAKTRCEQLGGHLPIVETAAENAFVTQLADDGFTGVKLTNRTAVWLGYSDAAHEGAWRWLDGSLASYTNWGKSQPNNREKEHFAVLLPHGPGEGGLWHDWRNALDGYNLGFICEWDESDSVPVNRSDGNSGAASNVTSGGIKEPNWTPLFRDGKLAGNLINKGDANDRFVVDSELTVGPAKRDRLLLTRSSLTNFRARLEYRVEEGAEAALIFRCPNANRGREVGYSVGLSSEPNWMYNVNGVFKFTFKSAISRRIQSAASEFSISTSEWHTLEVLADGDHLKVAADGIVIHDFRDSTYATGSIGLHARRAGLTVRRFEYVELANQGDSLEFPAVEVGRNEPPNTADDAKEAIDNSSPFAGEDWMPLFDGNSLAGWRGDLDNWSVSPADNAIVGQSDGSLTKHAYLISDREFEDFTLKLKFKLHGHQGNSGVQFRATELASEGLMQGYQADIADRNDRMGQLYEEKTGRAVAGPTSPEVRAALSLTLVPDGWNELVVTAIGDHITQSINGITTVDIHDPVGARSGKIGLQLHSTMPVKISFKDVFVRPASTQRVEDWTPIFAKGKLSKNVSNRSYDFKVRDSYLVSPKRSPDLLFTNQKFKDFRVRVEYRVTNEEADCALLLRCPNARVDREVAYSVGMNAAAKGAFNINNLFHYRFMSGRVKKINTCSPAIALSLNEWHLLEADLTGDHIRVWFDGELIHEIYDSLYGEGAIGLSAATPGFEIRTFEYLTKISRGDRGA